MRLCPSRSGGWVTGFLEPSETPWYPGFTLKDSVLNLLVFLLVFVGAAVLFLASYGLFLLLVPGGRGLVFSSPYAAALMPALFCALAAALFRAHRKPGHFPVTWGLLAGAFLLLLTLPLPLIQSMPPVRSADASPLVPGRFLPLEDGSLLMGEGQVSVLIPADTQPMAVSTQTDYDALNQRFVFSDGEPRDQGSTGPERSYFQYTPSLASFQTDLLALYTVLRTNAASNPLLFWFQAAAVSWMFLGLFLVFSLRTIPLVHGILLLLLIRLGLVFLVYAFWSLPALVDLWTTGAVAHWLRSWAPVILIDVTAATLFFMTWLAKPHRPVEPR